MPWTLIAAGIAAMQVAAGAAPSEESRIAAAASAGQSLYVFDRAAWVSTDALKETAPNARLAEVRGYVVERVDGRTLRATYYGGAPDAANAMFVADVRDGRVVRRELLSTPVPLTRDQTALVRARTAAADAAIRLGFRPCTPAPFNTVILPPQPGGPTIVYLLSAQTDLKTYPIGGNYRVVVSPDGAVRSSRPFTRSCIVTGTPAQGVQPVGLVVSHLLDPVPTEIHVLASYSLHLPLFVVASDKRMWKVAGNRIGPADPH